MKLLYIKIQRSLSQELFFTIYISAILSTSVVARTYIYICIGLVVIIWIT
jgi:hypothetical protein